ncbi:MAG: HypC/HybG/HupF family hydrogenase formation chaperone [Legionellales bacterium]|nr:HypC/HybG/HupF family hydrogenase formation chaperone [Legionellales bacterium]
MCHAIPAQIIELMEPKQAVIDLGGIRKIISVALLNEVFLGDYVIIHAGFALTKLDEQEAEKTLALFEEIS